MFQLSYELKVADRVDAQSDRCPRDNAGRDGGMRPGLDGLPGSAVLERLPLLKFRNARGSHIYIRPAGEHRYTVLDDLSEISLARLTADGFTPCAVVETSAGNFQVWLKHPTAF